MGVPQQKAQRGKGLKPFIKWAGGKRWLVSDPEFVLPEFDGRYIEPFLGGGAVFFHLAPKAAVLSDINIRLMETYKAIQTDWRKVLSMLQSLELQDRPIVLRGRLGVRTGVLRVHSVRTA